MVKNYPTLINLTPLFFLLLAFSAFSQSPYIDNTPGGSETFTVPAGVWQITVVARGAGGAGGGSNINFNRGGGGGAGGSYASSIINVIPGQIISYNVGSGAIGVAGAGSIGGGSWVINNITVFAQGGAGGAASNYESGAPGGIGSTALSFGTTLLPGISGNNGTGTIGAAGGAGANGGGAGGAELPFTGASNNGNSGTAPGGGGGGGFVNTGASQNGGNGGNGQVIITYAVCVNPPAPTLGSIIQPTCSLSTGSVTLSGLPSGNWTLTRSPGNILTTGNGINTTISGLVSGTYTYTVTSASNCTSIASANVVINIQPATPTIPILGIITHPTCTTATGSIALSGLPATGTWTLTRSPGAITSTGTGTSTTISGLVANTYTYTVTNASGCVSTASANVVINAQPATPVITPTTTGALVCIGASATLSASGAVATERYLWYNAATGGTLLKTSTNNTDNIYTTAVLTATTNYWVTILNAGGCESARTIVTATFPANSPDSQTTAGTDTWIGHMYDGTNAGVTYNNNFTNYYGTFTESETFDENFGGNTTCFAINSSLGGRSIYTETFAVRYRMNSTRKGLYVVDLGSDDGSRLTLDGTLIYNNWVNQGWTLRPRVLMSLTGNSTLLYDFYENTGGNRVNFNNLIQILSNTLSTNTTQNICPGNLGNAISGDTYGTLPAGISLSGTGYQWTYSTTLGGARTNITGATGATFTPNATLVPFNNPGTYYLFRNASVISTNNIGVSPYIATNESNVATIVINGVNTWNGSANDRDWNNAANWCSGVPNFVTNNLDVLIPSGLLTNYPIISAVGAPGEVVNIVFEANTTLNVRENSLRVTHNLTLNGNSKIDFEGESQLLQDTGSSFSGTGTIEIDQQGTSDNFKYNYWGSPVNKTGTTYTIAGVLRDGTVPAAINEVNYINFGAPHGYADVAVTSPIRLSTYWMYKYANLGNGYSGWTSVGKDGTLKVGEGFTMKGSNSNLSEQNYTFVGTPNNGDINLTISVNNDYLIGNPYPSAIDAKQFIKDNINQVVVTNPTDPAETGNGIRLKNIIDGNLYFWDHFGGGNHLLKSYEGGYAIFNLSGSVLAVSNDVLTKNTGATSNSGKSPQRFIPVAQGFFVTSLDGGQIQFKNSQRIFKKENASVSQFMKSAKTSKAAKETDEDIFPRFHLNYNSPKGYQRQLLMAFIENTTDGIDIGYDAINNETFAEDMAWRTNNINFIIQAVPTLNDERILPLEIKVATTGIIKLSIDNAENIPDDTEIFIMDSTTGKMYNISQKPFEIELAPGTYLERFALTFKTQKLLAEDVKAEILIPAAAQPIIEGIHVFMNNSTGELQIKNNSTEEVLSVALINSLGQTIKIWNSNFNIRTISLPISTATGVYLVQINTKTGKTVKKISVE